MITLCRASERRHETSGGAENWFTALAGRGARFAGFGDLESLAEHHLVPGVTGRASVSLGVDTVVYVWAGALAYEDSRGGAFLIQPGEFHRIVPGVGVRHSESNASQTDWTCFISLGLRSSEPLLVPSHEGARFSRAQRRGGLRVVASHDGRRGSVRLHQDVLVHSALLDRGQHVVHELAPGRIAWLHVVEGEATVGDLNLFAGDGTGARLERSVSVTARERSEVLLLDLPDASWAPPKAFLRAC